MPIADSLLAYNPRDTYLWAFVVGIANTLRVAVIGIVLATILGTLIGISRLSANWLLSRFAAVYVEMLRDIPLLLQLLFWYVLMQGAAGRARGLAAGRGRIPVQSRPDPAGDPGRLAAALGARHSRARACRVLSHQAMADRAADARRQAAAGVALCGWPHRRAAGGGVGGARRVLDDRMAGAARLQLRRRADARAGVFRAADRARDLHLGLHRRDRAQRHPVGAARTMGCRQCARLAPQLHAAADHPAAGAARHRAADDEPVPQPDQELLARGRDRLPGRGLDRQYHAEPDRAGDRGASR